MTFQPESELPRGTGKSTWVDATVPRGLKIDLLKESTFAELLGHAERLEAMADAPMRSGLDCYRRCGWLPSREGLAGLGQRLS